MTETIAENAKTAIRPNVANMVKAAGGSYHKDDFVGTTLNGLTVAQVLEIGTALGMEVAKYGHLNPGQQRMTVGNKIRKLTAIREVPEVGGKPDQKVVDANEAAAAVRDQIEDLAEAAKEANKAAAEAKAAEKAAKSAAVKSAKKAKGAAPVESEGGEV